MSVPSEPHPRTAAEAERWAVHAAMTRHADVYEDASSARSPGWYQADCDCGWYTTGHEPVAEDTLYEHVHDEHQDWWRPLVREPIRP